MFHNVFHLIMPKRLDYTDRSKIFHSIMIVLMLILFWIFNFLESLESNFERRIKCVSLNIQLCQTKSKMVNIRSYKTLYYPFSVDVNKCGGTSNTFDYPYA